VNGPRRSKRVGVLTKTFRIIDVLQSSASPLTLTEISERTGINKSTALRFLAHLETERYVARDAKAGYTVGDKLRPLGARSTLEVNLREASQAPLRELWRTTQETVNLGVLDGQEVVYLDCLESPHSFRLVANAGTRAVAYRTALGKAILAFFPANRRKAMLESLVFQAFTPKTITSAERFRNELDRVRKRGYSIDDEESLAGVRCLAAPILNVEQEAVAAVSISGPTARMTKDKLPEFAATIRAAAHQISASLRPAG
jgi:DNA-binding IclR family transcriptional regulator